MSQPNNNELIALIATLTKENESLKSKATHRKAQGAAIRVSAKGGVSVYGLGRFPVTLYKSQWEKLLSMVPDINQFLADNAASLKTKGGDDSVEE